jgi:multiple sugar transport system permease protein
MFYPFLFQVMASLGTNSDYYNSLILPIPSEFHLERYINVLKNPLVSAAFINTILRSIWVIFFTCFTSIICSFVFSKMRFRGRDVTFMIFLSSMMVPPQVAIIPNYLLYARWPLAGGNDWLGQGGHGMLDSWSVLLVPSLVNVAALFLVKQMMESLPYEYEEAARVDGAGVFRRIFGIYMPMVQPVLVVVIITTFNAIWNDYLWPLVTISNPKMQVISTGVASILSSFLQTGIEIEYPIFFALTTLVMVPPVLVYLWLQKSFIQGFAMAGVKG